MSIILDNVNYTYSAGTAYEIRALKNINLKIVGNAEKYLIWTKKIETVENLLTGKGQKYNAIEVI